jgi:lauroyl/myristoyl acyltransferase
MRTDRKRKLPWRIRYLCDGVGSLFKAMGIKTATRLAQALARRIFELEPPIRRVTEENLEKALGPDLTPEQRIRLTQRVFENVGSFWVELLHCRRRLSPGHWQGCVEVGDIQSWRALAAERRPLLLTTGYFGNPAVAACVLSELLGPVHAIVDPVARMLIDAGGGLDQRFSQLRLVDAYRTSLRAPMILKNGGRLLILTGRQTPGPEGVDARFLGRVGRHHATIARLAHRHRADIVVFSCRRLDGEPFRFRLSMDDHIRPNGRPGSAATVTQQYLDGIEKTVLDHPDQYLWTRT